jgi:hypothetical protein
MDRGTPSGRVSGSGCERPTSVVRGVFGLVLVAISAWAIPVRGAESGADQANPSEPRSSPPPEVSRTSCLSAHEQSQVLRIDAKLIDSRQLLRHCADESCPAVIRSDCLKWLDDVEQSIPTVVIQAHSERGDETDVKVSLNGHPWLDRLDGRPVELNPGAYQLRCERGSALPVSLQVVVRQGEKNRVVTVDFSSKSPPVVPQSLVDMSPVSASPPDVPPNRPIPPAVYILGGVTVVAAAAALWAGFSARADRNRAEETCAPNCPARQVSDIRRKALFSDIASATALASAGTALVLYLTRPAQNRPAGPSSTAAVVLTPLPSGGLMGSFRVGGTIL